MRQPTLTTRAGVIFWSCVAVPTLLAVCGCPRAAPAQYPQSVPYAFRLPLYGSARIAADPSPDPPAAPDAPATRRDVESLRDELREIKKILQDAAGNDEEKKPGADVRNEGALKALTEGLAVCGKCHAPDTAKKGDNFVMFTTGTGDKKGNNVLREDFRGGEMRNIIAYIKDGRMPKKGTLTQAQRDAILGEMNARLDELNK